MNNLLSRLVGDKKDWKRMEARAAELPADYRDRKSTRQNSSHNTLSRMPSSA